MGVQKLKQANSGIDWSKYTNINKVGAVSAGATFTPVLEINGEGFLTKAIAQGTSVVSKIRITIDGTVQYLGLSTHSDFCTGILSESNTLIKDGSSNIYTIYFNSFLSLHGGSSAQLAPGEQTACVLLASPLFFKKSLLIEISTGSGTSNIGSHIVGGFK